MKGIKIILIISLLSLLACNQGYWQDQLDKIKKKAGNLKEDIAQKLQEYEIESKIENFKNQAQEAMNDIYQKLSKSAEEAKEKIEAYSQKKLARLLEVKDEKLEEAKKIFQQIQDSDLYISMKKQINDEYEKRSKQVINFALEKKDEAFEFFAKQLFKANDKLDKSVKDKEASFYEIY